MAGAGPSFNKGKRRAPAGPTGNAWKAWLIALVGSPLALLLSGGARPANADDEVKPAPIVQAITHVATPPKECLRRFLTPIDQLAGRSSAGESKQPESAAEDAKSKPSAADAAHSDKVAKDKLVKKENGATPSTVTPPPAPPDWTISVQASVDALRKMLSNDSDKDPAMRRDVHVDTMIATIADPVESGLDYAFDTTLQALRLGVEHGGSGEGPDHAQLYRDRSWLAWRDFDNAGNARPDDAACRETMPGIMIFRNSQPSRPQFRILLLVGETPTRGVHVAAMINALQAARELDSFTDESGHRTYPAREMRIIGPTFSGSASSLRLAIEKWAEDPSTTRPPIRLVTGSATGSSLLATLGKDANWRHDLDVAFTATTLPAATVECSYLHLVQRLGSERETPQEKEGRLSTSDRAKLDREPTLLPQVAMLHESGTEFGASANPTDRNARPEPRGAIGAALSCPFGAGVQISFPLHIASLREAYEEADRKEAKEKDGVARATSLAVSLHEKHQPLDAQSNPSPKTTYAQDVALAGVLAQISIEKVTHVGIQATDVADAIFLARKIRDIAPDVRLAFFENDALLAHTDFQRDLRGSLILGPYPFLGSSHFAANGMSGIRSYAPFENAAAEGTFNAVLASRGFGVDDLFEYTAPSSLIPLPVWSATIGRTGVVPLGVARAIDCQKTVYAEGGALPDAMQLASLCDPSRRAERNWKAFNDIQTLDLKSDVPLPRLWLFLFALLSLAFVADQYRLWRTRVSLSDAAMPREFDKSTDQAADLAIGRTKWLLYASIRSFLFALAFAYVSYVDFLSRIAMPKGALPDLGSRGIAELFATLLAFAASLYLLGGFAKNYFHFVRTVRKSFITDSLRKSLPDILSLTYSASRRAAARTSCAQLGMVGIFAFVLSCGFAYLAHKATFDAANGLLAIETGSAVPTLTLFVLRTVSLGNGVSPAAPALFCLGSVYAWSIGRMARLAAAHATSRISPNDRESDLVSTPLRLVLYPSHDPCVPSSEHGAEHPPPADGGFTRVERAVANAIWRPIAGPLYVSCAIAVIAFPVLLFALKPLATIEVTAGSWLLGGGLVVATSLIGITLLQLIRYWLALEHMLKRTMGHPLGAALSSARPFVRESVDDQLSRSPNDLLRLAACGPLFDELMQGAVRERIDFSRATIGDTPINFVQLRQQLDSARNRALDASSLGDATLIASASAELGQCVIRAAAGVTRLLEYTWQGQGSVVQAREAEAVTQRSSGAQAVGHDTTTAVETHVGMTSERTSTARTSGPMPAAVQSVAAPRAEAVAIVAVLSRNEVPPSSSSEASDHPRHDAPDTGGIADALAPVAWQFGPGELPWLRECQAFVATVVALVVSRYVRQLRYFLYAMTASIGLLLLALSSYPFEPHRLLQTCSWGIVGSIVGAGLWIFIELDRNAVISQLSGTDPGKVTLNGALVIRIFAWVVLPLLGVAATTYPDIANMLYRLVEPFVRSLR